MFDLKTEKEAREAVQLIASAGGDHVKVNTGLPRSLYVAILDEAKKHGLPVTGHLPMQVRAIEGAEWGRKSMEHLNGLFMATSSMEKELLKEQKLSDILFYMKSEIDPRAKYVPTAIQKQWVQAIRSMPPEVAELTEEYTQINGELVNKMSAADVPLLAGTDSSFVIQNQIFGIFLA